jgi:hypothetical protein
MQSTSISQSAAISAVLLAALASGCSLQSQSHVLFDGKSLAGWKKTEFGGHVDPRVEDGKLILPAGEPMTGVTWTGEPPTIDYEIELEAMRVDGGDFFCGLTFPVRDASASLILGGWGGGVCGVSSFDGQDASENETTTYHQFQSGKWYHIRLRVTEEKIEAWLDAVKIVDAETKGRRIDVRADIALAKPLGVSTWRTTGALRDIRWRAVEGSRAPEVPSSPHVSHGDY